MKHLSFIHKDTHLINATIIKINNYLCLGEIIEEIIKEKN